jgi:hypothetical protein
MNGTGATAAARARRDFFTKTPRRSDRLDSAPIRPLAENYVEGDQWVNAELFTPNPQVFIR